MEQANGLIRREFCSCEGGDCIALYGGDAHACSQLVSFPSAASGSAGRSCPRTGH
ncbi:MAG: cysteine-rich VLP protein [Clostridiales bacterium]|nr:cysteine-rich VLP protein [Clostridiales bacterium]MDO4351147.1 cysteine-rich VLP protein [Eubacteriales bacterium]MDY4008815.1 cysteine-rich VLP protein [Candidatus Limiplasma sp.]